MTRVFLIVAMLAGLSACGVDGRPTAPEPRPATGLSITGTAEIGIVGGS
jgi:hypothetical protein